MIQQLFFGLLSTLEWTHKGRHESVNTLGVTGSYLEKEGGAKMLLFSNRNKESGSDAESRRNAFFFALPFYTTHLPIFTLSALSTKSYYLL